MKLEILLVSYLLLVSSLCSGDNNTTDSNLTTPYPKATILKEGVPDAVNDNNFSNWNVSNWQNYFKGKGADDSVIGNTQAMVGGTAEGKIAFDSNPNFLTTDALKDNENVKTNPAISGMDSSTQQEVLSRSLNNVYVSLINIEDSIKCYITRDVSFRWQCNYTGLIYGGRINESGRVAKQNCINDCFEQKACVNINPESSVENVIVPKLDCDFSLQEECSASLALNKDKIIEKLTINFAEKEENNNYLIDISLSRDDGTTRVLNKNLRRDFIDDNVTINIRESVKDINLTVKIFNDNNTSISDILNVELQYRKDDKWICRSLQDVNNVDGGNYGYSCSSGNVVTFVVGGKTYKICNDGGLGADNQDGTFSTKNSCLSICKMAKDCTPDFSTFTTEAVKTLREGCIEGQAGCNNEREDCKASRLKGDVILNEVVFDATAEKRITIQNSVQVKDTKRPKVDPGEDLDFERRNQEEWKDEAFKNMATKAKYSFVKSPIGENTEAQSAYRMQFVSGASYGVTGTAIRQLNWLLKPEAYDVNNNQTNYLYTVLVANLGYHEYASNGKLEKKRKQIWYIKTSDNDTFKAIKVGFDLGYNSINDNNNTIFVETAASQLSDKTFISNSWIGLSPFKSAEYFKTIKFGDNDKPYWTFPVVSKIGNLIYMLPGMVRSVERKDAAYDIYKYNGSFDGSGDGMLNFSIYTYYSTTPITYAQLYEKMSNEEAKKIYKQGEEYLYVKNVDGDGHKNKNVELFQYGTADKSTIYTRVFPNKDDIGKKGFIYVFIQ